MSDTITKLSQFFTRLPGIGKRQAKRFVYFLLSQDSKTIDELTDLLKELKQDIVSCTSCARFFVGKETQTDVCAICSNKSRDTKTLMVVEKDVDLETIESSGEYKGQYFVLGGTVPILDDSPAERVRAKELQDRVNDGSFDEIILAVSATPEGENTAQYVRTLLKDFKGKTSKLGRGLSTGAELEYSDEDTIKNALANRG